MDRDDNMQQKQENEEHAQWLEEQTRKELNAMSDEEFYKWIGAIEMEVKK